MDDLTPGHRGRSAGARHDDRALLLRTGRGRAGGRGAGGGKGGEQQSGNDAAGHGDLDWIGGARTEGSGGHRIFGSTADSMNGQIVTQTAKIVSANPRVRRRPPPPGCTLPVAARPGLGSSHRGSARLGVAVPPPAGWPVRRGGARPGDERAGGSRAGGIAAALLSLDAGRGVHAPLASLSAGDRASGTCGHRRGRALATRRFRGAVACGGGADWRRPAGEGDVAAPRPPHFAGSTWSFHAP